MSRGNFEQPQPRSDRLCELSLPSHGFIPPWVCSSLLIVSLAPDSGWDQCTSYMTIRHSTVLDTKYVYELTAAPITSTAKVS